MSETTFRAAGYPWRLYCGREVIEQDLQQAVDGAGSKRVFVVCSSSVNRRTDIVRRIAAALGVLSLILGRRRPDVCLSQWISGASRC
jgi:hypothetical protein